MLSLRAGGTGTGNQQAHSELDTIHILSSSTLHDPKCIPAEVYTRNVKINVSIPTCVRILVMTKKDNSFLSQPGLHFWESWRNPHHKASVHGFQSNAKTGACLHYRVPSVPPSLMVSFSLFWLVCCQALAPTPPLDQFMGFWSGPCKLSRSFDIQRPFRDFYRNRLDSFVAYFASLSTWI